MDYRFPRNITLWMCSITLLLLFGNIAPVHAQEGPSLREKQRKALPLDQLIKNLEDPKREKTMQPGKVVDFLGVKQGEIIADVGAGTGFFTFRLAAKTGPEGKVYAVEIEDKLLDYIRKKMDKDKVTNIIPVKSSEQGPNLPPASCDKILVCNSYYYFSDPVKFMDNVRNALKPGGLVAVIDIDGAKVQVKQPFFSFKEKPSLMGEVVEEMERAGFVLQKSHDFLQYRFYMVFAAGDGLKRERKPVPPLELKRLLAFPKKEQEMQPERVFDALGVKPGDSVADLGTGTGFFSFRLADKTGEGGKVFAVDCKDDILDYIRKQMEENKVTNVIPVKYSDEGPNLPPASCDKILVVDTYNHLPNPVAFMSKLRKALKPGGLVAVINRELPKRAINVQFATMAEVIDEMRSAGFTLRASHDFLEPRFFLVFSATQ